MDNVTKIKFPFFEVKNHFKHNFTLKKVKKIFVILLLLLVTFKLTKKLFEILYDRNLTKITFFHQNMENARNERRKCTDRFMFISWIVNLNVKIPIFVKSHKTEIFQN